MDNAMLEIAMNARFAKADEQLNQLSKDVAQLKLTVVILTDRVKQLESLVPSVAPPQVN